VLGTREGERHEGWALDSAFNVFRSSERERDGAV
jgi:hypothetical protein